MYGSWESNLCHQAWRQALHLYSLSHLIWSLKLCFKCLDAYQTPSLKVLLFFYKLCVCSTYVCSCGHRHMKSRSWHQCLSILLCFLPFSFWKMRRGLMCVQLAANVLHKRGWPWFPDARAFTSQVHRLQACATIPGFMWYWAWSPGLHALYIRILPTELHPDPASYFWDRVFHWTCNEFQESDHLSPPLQH